MHMGHSVLLSMVRASDGPSLYAFRVSRGLQGVLRGGRSQSAAARTFENAASRFDRSDQGFAPSIIGSGWEKHQGPRE